MNRKQPVSVNDDRKYPRWCRAALIIGNSVLAWTLLTLFAWHSPIIIAGAL